MMLKQYNIHTLLEILYLQPPHPTVRQIDCSSGPNWVLPLPSTVFRNKALALSQFSAVGAAVIAVCSGGVAGSVGVGICGPLIGAALSHGSDWRWLFRLNLPFCLGLGALVYSTHDDIYKTTDNATKLSDIDLVSALFSVGFIVPSLVGLSFAGSRYEWADWRTAAPIAVGCACLLLFLVWELRLCHSWLPFQKYRDAVQPFTGLVILKNTQGVSAVIGAVLLGALIYALLFFLPIYYLVIKGHSPLVTALLLLSHTLMMAPCGAAVFVLVEKVKLSSHQVIVCGWIFTVIGFGLLSLLNASTTVVSDVLLNLASGVGIGILLPALTLGAEDSVKRADRAQAPMVVVYMRYLGSASGLIGTGLAFQRLLNRNLASTRSKNTAEELTKHATTLMHSINRMPRSRDRDVLVEATQDALSTIWIALAITCTFLVVLSCTSAAAAADKREVKVPSRHSIDQAGIQQDLLAKPDLIMTSQPRHWSRMLASDHESYTFTICGYSHGGKDTQPS